jgi:ABC-type multidrug transport system fused ATPase/permease subunit
MNGMLVLLGLVRFSPRYFATTVFFAMLLFFILPIPIGLATRAFFDSLAGGQSAGLNAWSAIAIIVALEVCAVIASPALGNPWNAMQQKSHVLLQRNLFAGLLRGYGTYGLPASVGETISRFRDDPHTMGDGLDALCDLIGRSFFALGAAVVMWQINATMTIVLFVPMLLSSFLMEVLGTRTMAYRAASHAATSRVTGFLGEVLSAHLALKVAGSVDHAVTRLRELGDERRRMAVRDSVFDELLDSFNFHMNHIGTGIVLLIGAQAIADGTFSVGDLALFVVYLDQLAYLAPEIGRVISDVKRTEVSYGRMRQLVPGEPPAALVAAAPVFLNGHVPPIPPSPTPQPLTSLEVRGLTYAHPDGTRGISDVSFTLARGAFVVVTGRVGAGKTTLLHVLLGLLPRDSGEIRWNGVRIDDPATFFVPPRSAFTPQVPRLFSESLRANLLLGRDFDEAQLQRAVRAAVLEQDVEQLDQGLDTLIGPRGVKLSGGQVQRAAAARMFVHDAELLVFDDLSSALDPQTESELWSRLFARGRDVTCLVVSHRPAALRRADQVLVLENGHLVSTTSGAVASEA